MVEFIKEILTGQFEASLAMMKLRIEACPLEYWEGMVGSTSFRQVAYHALFYLDLYLSADENSFSLSSFNLSGGDDREYVINPGLSKEATFDYIEFCRSKIHSSLAAETENSLRGNSGFSWRKTSRGELHVYNIRHFQHHIGQLSTYLRRISEEHSLALELPWVGSGWK